MRIHFILMAAGNSRRFGSNKLLHELDGKPLYRHGLDTLLTLMPGHPEYTLTIVSQYAGILEGARKRIIDWEKADNKKTVVEGLAEGRPAKGKAAEERSAEENPDTENASDYYSSSWGRYASVYSPRSREGVSFTIKAGLSSVIEAYGEAGQLPEEDYLIFMVADQPYLRAETLEKLAEACKLRGGWGASLCFGSQVGNPCAFSAECTAELMALEGDQGGRKVLKKHPILYIEAENPRELYDIDMAEDI